MRKRTSNNYTYNMGSHVLQFGSLSIDEEPAADYLGELNTGEPPATICCMSVLSPWLELSFAGLPQPSDAELICGLGACARLPRAARSLMPTAQIRYTLLSSCRRDVG